MQTFLPYPSFIETARCLDNKRLGKQRIETWQIYLALTIENYGWKNHPIVKMWKDYIPALLCYGNTICEEWIKRGFKDNLKNKFVYELSLRWLEYKIGDGGNIQVESPFWLGNEKFHASHRSNLLRKDYKYYSQLGWKEPNNLPYIWIKNE